MMRSSSTATAASPTRGRRDRLGSSPRSSMRPSASSWVAKNAP